MLLLIFLLIISLNIKLITDQKSFDSNNSKLINCMTVQNRRDRGRLNQMKTDLQWIIAQKSVHVKYRINLENWKELDTHSVKQAEKKTHDNRIFKDLRMNFNFIYSIFFSTFTLTWKCCRWGSQLNEFILGTYV